MKGRKDKSKNNISWLIYLYSCVVIFAAFVIKIISIFSPFWKKQLEGRDIDRAWIEGLERKRRSVRHAVLFFCSSAGEFEQAHPMIDRLLERGDVMVQVLFFSRSGFGFAEARKEKVPYRLCPIDTVWHWKKIFSVLAPEAAIVVRHEYWPAFVAVAKTCSRLLLVDGTASRTFGRWSLARFVKSRLLNQFERLFLVDKPDLDYFESTLSLSPRKLTVVGDTKYDRVFERSRQEQKAAEDMVTLFERTASNMHRLVIGSAWHPDIEGALDAFRSLKMQRESSEKNHFAKDWQVVIASHDVSRSMIEWIKDACEKRGLSWIKLSSLSSETRMTSRNGFNKPSEPPAVIIIDIMGKLAEIYGVGNLAIVGGAMHNKVHNVLEPACRGLPIAFGPLHKNSREASLLVEKGLATVVTSANDIEVWWRQKALIAQTKDQSLLDHIHNQCGAATAITEYLKESLKD